mgnify:CR=1 FL=1
MEITEVNITKRIEILKANFESALKILENKIAQNLSEKSKSFNLGDDLSEIKNYVEETEKSLQELKSILKT